MIDRYNSLLWRSCQLLLFSLILFLGVSERMLAQSVQVDVVLPLPPGSDYKSIFPLLITNKAGNSYQLQPNQVTIQEGGEPTPQAYASFHSDCREQVRSQWQSFKSLLIYDEQGRILCDSSAYVCKARELIGSALADLAGDDCRVAYTAGTVVGPIAALSLGDLPAGGAVLKNLAVGSRSLRNALEFLQFFDRVTDLTTPLLKAGKVSISLVKRTRKLLPELRLGAGKWLTYTDGKLRLFTPKHSRGIDLTEKLALASVTGLDASERSFIRSLQERLPQVEAAEGATQPVTKQANLTDKTPTSDASPQKLSLAKLQEQALQRYKALGLDGLSSLPELPNYKSLTEAQKTELLQQLQECGEDMLRELDADPQALTEFIEGSKKGGKHHEEWQKKRMEGIRFNKERARFYPYNEVYIVSPKAKSGYVRLDSYDPQTMEIISRKYTQLSEVLESTALRYLKELADKYAPGSIIADVPSNRTGVNKGIFEANRGEKLRGQMILEIPVQTKAIPRRILEYAKRNYVRIRDINGKFYN